MGLPSKLGTYRGVISDSGMKESTNGFPQFMINLVATEYYDAQEQQWTDWSNENESIVAYLTLFGNSKKATLTAKQVQKVFGWSGQGFNALNVSDYGGIQLQFRVEQGEGKYADTLNVAWIDEYDVTPGGMISKLSPEKIKKLEKVFAAGLKEFGGTKVATKKTTKPSVPEVSEQVPEIPEAPEVPETPEVPEEDTSKPTATQAQAAKKKPGECTKSKAWRYVVELKQDNQEEMTDAELGELWTDAIQEAAPKAKQGKLTNAQWYKVREIVAKELIGF